MSKVIEYFAVYSGNDGVSENYRGTDLAAIAQEIRDEANDPDDFDWYEAIPIEVEIKLTARVIDTVSSAKKV